MPEQAIVALYVAHRAEAFRLARRICGEEGFDVVQDVVLYLLEHRDYLPAIPSPAYFLTAVRNGARRQFHYARARYLIAMDPGDLVLAEQAMQAPSRRDTWVRLPELEPAARG